ncbi:hypothetical protein [Microbacterium suaedae]|uniref:hypothetical protein n=1 Tax=Microbacterium suaedae TaxID=2067813 RepID=UPI0013A62423|nr:hypothetical protein [Microbacterium suaedae]
MPDGSTRPLGIGYETLSEVRSYLAGAVREDWSFLPMFGGADPYDSLVLQRS